MNEEQIKKLVIETIKTYNKSDAFTARKTTDTPTDSFSVVNKKYVASMVSEVKSSLLSITSMAAVASGSNTLSSVSGGLQAVVHNLGAVPSKFSFYSAMDGSASESTAKWHLSANGNKGIELHRFDNSVVGAGTLPYNFTGNATLIHVGQDVSNRMVATIKSSDTSVLTMEWTAVGSPAGTVRFVAEFE